MILCGICNIPYTQFIGRVEITYKPNCNCKKQTQQFAQDLLKLATWCNHNLPVNRGYRTDLSSAVDTILKHVEEGL